MGCENGHKAAVEFIIARKANVNHMNNLQEFALYYAAEGGHTAVCEVLLKAGADKDMKMNGQTAA